MQEVELLQRKTIYNKSVLNNLNYYEAQYEESKKETGIIKRKFDEYKETYVANMKNCNNHIPVTLGRLSKVTILDEKGNTHPVMYRKCLLCGNSMIYNYNLEYDIDATNFEPELNDNYENLDKKYIHILSKLTDFCAGRYADDEKELLNDFKIFIENNGYVPRKRTKTKAKK